MFTGLIEEIGIIKNVRNLGGGRSITITAKEIMDDVKIDDSISINGVCQTVVAVGLDYFEVEAVEETLSKTTLGSMRTGLNVNLERATKVGDRLGGHIVQGHIDTTGTVKSIEKQLTGILVWIEFPIEFSKYAVRHGSICIDGVSLTIARLRNNMAMLSIIPHTWSVTTLAELKNGSKINIEFDIIGKYVENLLIHKSNNVSESSSLAQYLTQPDW